MELQSEIDSWRPWPRKLAVAHYGFGLVKFLLGFVLVGTLILLPRPISLNFFSAFSACLALVYLVSLINVRYLGDGLGLGIPALFILLLQAVWRADIFILGLCLFAHLLMAFFSGLSHRSGSLQDLRIWPLLLGTNGALFLLFMGRFSL